MALRIFAFSICTAPKSRPDGWLHGEEGDDLKEVILDDVAQTACGFIKCAAGSDSEGLRQSDLDVGDVVAIPDGLQKSIGEAEIEDVHDRFLGEEVIDAEDRVFGEDGAGDAIEFAGRGEVATEGLFDNDAGVLGELRGAEGLNDGFEEHRRNGEVERRPARVAQRAFDGGEGGGVFVIAAHVLDQATKDGGTRACYRCHRRA